MPCIFCQIVSGQSPSFKVWENEKYLAFLSIFPNTEGVSVVIPKEHFPSYIFELPEEVLNGLVAAGREVATLLDSKLEDVGRTAVVAEGFGVDHAHLKLFPMHGTKSGAWEQHKSKIDTYFELYPGYVSSNDSARAEDEQLERVAKKIRE